MPARRVKSGTALARRLLPGRQAAIKNWQSRNAHLCRHHLRHLWEKLDPLSLMAWNKCVLECLQPRRRHPPPLICRNPQFEGFEVWQTAAPSSRHASAPPASPEFGVRKQNISRGFSLAWAANARSRFRLGSFGMMNDEVCDTHGQFTASALRSLE